MRWWLTALGVRRKKIAKLQTEATLLVEARGVAAPQAAGSSFEAMSAEQAESDRAAQLVAELKKVRSDMKAMKGWADRLQSECDEKVEAAEREVVVAEAAAKPSGPVHTEVLDGSVHTRIKHLQADAGGCRTVSDVSDVSDRLGRLKHLRMASPIRHGCGSSCRHS